jgi:hypothetical protein
LETSSSVAPTIAIAGCGFALWARTAGSAQDSRRAMATAKAADFMEVHCSSTQVSPVKVGTLGDE